MLHDSIQMKLKNKQKSLTMTTQNVVGAGGWGALALIQGRGVKASFQGDGNVLQFDLDSDCMDVYMCENSLRHTFKIHELYCI